MSNEDCVDFSHKGCVAFNKKYVKMSEYDLMVFQQALFPFYISVLIL